MPCIASRRVIMGSKPRKKTFNECTWAEVAEICRAGYAAEYWAIGDTKNMVDGDTTTTLRIIGFDHDWVSDVTTYGREKAGITLQMVKAQPALKTSMNGTSYKNLSWYSAASGNACAMRSTTLPNYLASTIPDALKSVLVPVGKEFYYKEKNGIQSISDTLFLLSANEIFGTYTSGFGSEGEQYAYYAAGNSKTIYNTDGSAVSWWTRSPYQASNGNFYYVTGQTLAQIEANTATIYGVPCMCI